MARSLRAMRATALLAAAGAALAGCATSDPTESTDAGTASSDTIVVGSHAFPEAEILGEIYAQMLEAEGFDVERALGIGGRPQTLPALQDGTITVLPEFTGNLLLFLDDTAEPTTPEATADALDDALEGSGLVAYDHAEAQDVNSFVVTAELAEEHDLESVGDLASLGRISLASNPQFAELPFGLPGLASIYDVTDVEFVPIEDYGGPSTVQALIDGTVDVADISSTSPALAEEDFVVLDDTEALMAPQNVVPLLSESVASDELEAALDAVSAALTTDDLIALRTRVEGEELASPATAARDWLVERGLVAA